MTPALHDFSNKKVKHLSFRNATVVASDFTNANLSGDIDGLVINGVAVAPLVTRELERLYPERKGLFASTPEELKRSFGAVFGLLAATFERASRLTEAQRHERVDDEWSVVETIRHLVFAVDAWIQRAVLGRADPFDPIALPFSEMRPVGGMSIDANARPTFGEAVGVWKKREGVIVDVLDALTPEELDRRVVVSGDGYPYAGTTVTVIEALWCILEESWWHNRFMNRDMDVIEASS